MNTCYDMSVDGAFAKNVPWAVRATGVYHLWALHKTGVLTDSKYWHDALAQVQAGKFTWLNIEPDQSSVLSWRRPCTGLPELNTHFKEPVTPKDVEETHSLICQRLAPLCAAAKLTKAPVWDYRTLQVNSLEMCASEYPKWKAETQRIAALNGGQFARLLKDTGGGIIYEVYVPQQWNSDASEWLRDKALIALERHAAVYDQLGIRSMPLLNPVSVGVGGGKQLHWNLLNKLVQAARSRGDWGWWSEAGKTTKVVAEEVGAWIK